MAFTEAEATGRSADEEMNRTVELVTFQAPATKVSKNTAKADKERLVPGETSTKGAKEKKPEGSGNIIFATQQEGAIDGI